VASLIRSVEDLIVEDREVKGKTQADGVSRGQLGLGDLGGSLVGLEGLVSRVLALVADGKLSKVAVIIALPISSRHVNMMPHSSRDGGLG
jgi:hypothetical protein